jgi:hypothetical protein
MKTTISNFTFNFTGHGHYKVTYTSPVTYKQWSVIVNEMSIIDETKNAESPKLKDLNRLKRICKNK